MNEAIKLAIEKGGYKDERVDLGSDGNLYIFSGRFYENELENRLVLNPLFWQALGKALGMEKVLQMARPGGGYNPARNRAWWKYTALEYFNLVLTGGNTEKFWKELLTKTA